MLRNLDGYYFGVKRDGKIQPICFSDMTREEMQEVGKNEDVKWWRSLAIGLGERLHEIGEELDLVAEIPE